MKSKSLSEEALALHRNGQIAEAEQLYRAALAADPKNGQALHMLGIVQAQQGRLEEALAGIAAALALTPDDPEMLLNHANVLKSLGRPAQALAGYAHALRVRPQWAQAENNRGTVLQALGHTQQALGAYDRALEIQPDYVEALNNRGSVLQDLKRPAEALAAYDQALRLKPDFAIAFNNRGSALLDLHRFADALACFERALRLRPGDAEVLNNRGNALQGLLRYEEAVAAYDQALALKPGYSQALSNRGAALQQLKRYEEALASFESAGSPEAFGGAAMAALNLCDWGRTQAIGAQMPQRIAAGESIPPWVLLGYSGDEALQRQCAANIIAQRFSHLPPPLTTGGYRHERIKLAYVSSDMAHHPVAAQIVQLIESHDRTGFEVIGVGTNPDDGSSQRKRLIAAFDHFIDAHQQLPGQTAGQLARLEVDILVDLNGHTRGDNFELMSHRPAPVQVSWLGYAGTTAASFVDYLIADRTVAPDPAAFSERLAYLPHCFFPNDSGRMVGQAPTRKDAGLPSEGFVFCCFNNNWKITAEMFALWMGLLAQLPHSVLWLKQPGDKAGNNLKRAAQAHGVDPQRLIFAEPAPLGLHLARHRLADLFLDTLPYNAHATACDALWAGLPVLSLRGTAFAGRVGASLLATMGLPELIAETVEDYQAIAFALGQDQGQLQSLRRRLEEKRTTSPLFDTKALALAMEELYRQMLVPAPQR